MRARFVAVVVLTGLGCAGAREDVTPPIAIAPGAAARLAQMDRFRLNDEQRRLWMQRPHVWAEEEPVDEDAAAPDAGEGGAAVPGE